MGRSQAVCAVLAGVLLWSAGGVPECPAQTGVERTATEKLISWIDSSIESASLQVSPDSKRVAYETLRRGILRRGKWVVVVDGVEGKEYDGIGESSPIFSPDSKRVAYGARRGEKWVVVVDGVEGKEYDGIRKGSLIFSPDSKRVAYEARRGEKWIVVVDGVEGKEYDGFLRGTKLIFDSAHTLHYLAVRGNRIYLVEEQLRE